MGVALLSLGVAGCERNARVDAWQAKVAWAKELTTSAIQTGHEKRAAALKAPLDEAKANLDAVVQGIEGQGIQVGYYVATASGEELFSKNADEVFYGASSIKGPFVLTTFSGGVPAGSRALVEDAIAWSSNEAYWSLRNIYGSAPLAEQLQNMGIDELSANSSFVHMTPAQLANLWLQNYWVLDSSPDAEWLRSLFESPEHAPIAALGEGSYSKGGWIASGDLNCTVDAGIVSHGENRYVMAVMISAGEDHETLARLVGALDAYEQADYAYLTETGQLAA